MGNRVRQASMGRQSVVLTNKLMAWGTTGGTAGVGRGQGSPVTKTRQQ